MNRLKQESLERALSFISERARRIDRTLARYWFDSGRPGDVLDAVAEFQNNDGGFGNAIEPDFRVKDSSPTATTVAFQYLRSVKAPAQHPTVIRGIKYLMDTYDQEHGWWEPVPPSVNEAPHASWWHYQGPATAFTANPAAEICACFQAYPETVPSSLLDVVTTQSLRHLTGLPDTMEMHDMLCYLHLADEANKVVQDTIVGKLQRGVREVVDFDTEMYSGYCAKPIWLASSPESHLADVIMDGVETNLEYEICNQSADGSWEPFWTWDTFPEDWKQARMEWQGHLTVKTLKALKDYGRWPI